MSTSPSACDECDITQEALEERFESPEYDVPVTKHFYHKLESEFDKLTEDDQFVLNSLGQSVKTEDTAGLKKSFLQVFVDGESAPSYRYSYLRGFMPWKPQFGDYLKSSVEDTGPWHFASQVVTKMWDKHQKSLE